MTDFAKFGLKVCFEGWEICSALITPISGAYFGSQIFQSPSPARRLQIPKILSAIDNHQQSDDSHYKPADFLSKILINVKCIFLRQVQPLVREHHAAI